MIRISRSNLIIALQSLVVVLLAIWLYVEYVHNRFMQEYLASMWASNYQTIPVVIVASGLIGGGLYIFYARRRALGLAAESFYFSQRAVKKLLRNPIFLLFSLIQPIIFLVIFTQLFDGLSKLPNWRQITGVETYLQFAAPGLILMNAFTSALQSGVTMVDDIQSGFMERVLVTPVRRASILLGRMMADAVRILIQSMILIALALAEGATLKTGVLGIVLVLGVIAFFGLAWAGISHSIGLRTKNQQAVFSAGFLLTFPLMFMSTMMMPDFLMVPWIRDVSQYNPISFAVNAVRSVMINEWISINWTALGQSILVIGALAAISLSSATLAFKKVVE